MVAWMCIIGPPLAVALMVAMTLPVIIKRVAADLFKRPKGFLSERGRLREAARRDGTYTELPSPEREQWNKQLKADD